MVQLREISLVDCESLQQIYGMGWVFSVE